MCNLITFPKIIIFNQWIRKRASTTRRRSPTGTGRTLNATSRLSRPTGRAPSGTWRPASSSPTLPVSPRGPTSASTSTPRSPCSTPTTSAGTGTRAGTSPTSPSDSRYPAHHSDQGLKHRRLPPLAPQPLRTSPDTQAQIFAVKKNTENEKTDRMTLIDVGIRGESKMEMIDGQVYFSAIKFSSTTYNN